MTWDKLDWERLEDSELLCGDNEYAFYRARVQGGWLVAAAFVEAARNRDGDSYEYGKLRSVTFVPDLPCSHVWESVDTTDNAVFFKCAQCGKTGTPGPDGKLIIQ